MTIPGAPEKTLSPLGTPSGREGEELWRSQNVRNLMDCYELAMEGALTSKTETTRNSYEELTRWMVEGMTVVKDKLDEKSFFKTAANLCLECLKSLESDFQTTSLRCRSLRIFEAIFEEMSH